MEPIDKHSTALLHVELCYWLALNWHLLNLVTLAFPMAQVTLLPHKNCIVAKPLSILMSIPLFNFNRMGFRVHPE